MRRLDQRQGFLLSAIAHLIFVTILVSHVKAPAAVPEEGKAPEAAPQPRARVFLPPPEVLRQLLPPPRPAVRPVPRSTPAPAPDKKQRISVGPPSELRQKGPLILRREDDLTAVPKGQSRIASAGAPTPPPPAAPTREPEPSSAASQAARPGLAGLPLPAGSGAEARGAEGAPSPRPYGPSITRSLRELDRRIGDLSAQGLPTGTGRDMGPLFFDPQGADFTAWINHFKNEVYRNWIPPQAALYGYSRGHVDFEFTIERDGTLSNLTMLKSSGTAALDRAAQNALLGSRLLPLPADYGPPRVTMQVTFSYGRIPQGS